MTAADRRRDAVARIVRSRRIGTQEELLAALGEAGFRATQATLSRDLARLGARRARGRGGWSALTRPEARPQPAIRLHSSSDRSTQSSMASPAK